MDLCRSSQRRRRVKQDRIGTGIEKPGLNIKRATMCLVAISNRVILFLAVSISKLINFIVLSVDLAPVAMHNAFPSRLFPAFSHKSDSHDRHQARGELAKLARTHLHRKVRVTDTSMRARSLLESNEACSREAPRQVSKSVHITKSFTMPTTPSSPITRSLLTPSTSIVILHTIYNAL